ncbi:hypothetical protein LC040_05980 [Bacillus tianshenii]|nr:hypothetical protein LC040_05980 [Bacillus tianshenii]
MKRKTSKLKAGVFIVESNKFSEEDEQLFEGEVLTKMLKLLDVEVVYKYIRTEKELKAVLKQFRESSFRYLHLACHGDEEGFGLTLDDISFEKFSQLLEKPIEKRRIFLSSCSVLQGDKLAEALTPYKVLSIVGPDKEIYFDDAAIFWASFYHLMFRENSNTMYNQRLKEVVKELSNIYSVSMKTLILQKNKKVYKRYECS